MKGWFVFCFLLLGSCERGRGRQDVKVVPNEGPPIHMVDVPVTGDASSYSGEESLPKEVKLLEPASMPKTVEPKEALRTYRDLELVQPETKQEAPDPRDRIAYLEEFQFPSGKREPSSLPGPVVPSSPVESPVLPVEGGRPFAPRPANEATGNESVLPPGEFFTARLVGNLNVTVSGAIVFAEIFGRNGLVKGTAIGRGLLHPGIRNRAKIEFDGLILDERRVQGNFSAFDLDLGEGLLGYVEQHNFKKVAMAIADAILAAITLEIDTGQDSFAGIFKLNLFNSLVKDGQGRLNQLGLDRQIHIPRGRVFKLAAIRESKLKATHQPSFPYLSTKAGEALGQTLDGQKYGEARQAELREAFRRMQAKITDLDSYPFKVEP